MHEHKHIGKPRSICSKCMKMNENKEKGRRNGLTIKGWENPKELVGWDSRQEDTVTRKF